MNLVSTPFLPGPTPFLSSFVTSVHPDRQIQGDLDPFTSYDSLPVRQKSIIDKSGNDDDDYDDNNNYGNTVVVYKSRLILTSRHVLESGRNGMN